MLRVAVLGQGCRLASFVHRRPLRFPLVSLREVSIYHNDDGIGTRPV